MKATRNTITVPIYTNRDQIDVTFPAHWVVCPDCNGRATTTRHVEADGGGLTASEFEECCRDCEDFADNYLSGVYDRPCPTCDGRSTVQEIDAERVSGWRERILFNAYLAQQRDGAEIDAIQAAERRMGA